MSRTWTLSLIYFEAKSPSKSMLRQQGRIYMKFYYNISSIHVYFMHYGLLLCFYIYCTWV